MPHQPLRILLILTHFYPHTGGVEKYAEELFGHLDKTKQTKTTVVCFSEGSHLRIEEYRGLRVFYVPQALQVAGVFVLPKLRFWREVMDRLKREEFDVVSTQTRFFFTSFLGVLVAKKRRIPLVHTEHGSNFVTHHSKLVSAASRLYDETLGRFVLTRATRITCVSQDVRAFLSHWLGVTSDVVNNGVDTDFWDPSQVKSDASKQREVARVTYVGRTMRAKGWLVLLEAVAKLPSEVQEQLEVEIIGAGPEDAELTKKIGELKLEKVVKAVGRKDATYIRQALIGSAYVNPSYSSEGLQTTLLEAAAMNSWIITTPVSGYREVLPEGMGSVVAKESVDDLAQALTSYVSNRPKGKTREHIVKHFSWESIASDYLHSLKKALAK